ncbi:SseB family protein [Micromonospora sp. NBC_01796]|uniref:SseB family protein n=1 Tax=Micromonospora sp. NBC_01796 TaxID=2975987 RepID=UPI002DDC6824|nr:SseB family protein [Micromonospora sp. NBC_01796]WSA85076.1 SseB family protein [Micromonospora sp. NBC_01796]
MDRPTAPWAPANEVERRLRDAADAGDIPELMGILAGAPLYLPGFRDDGGPADGVRQRLLTRDRDGVPYLPVFTSPEALHRTVTADGWRPTSLSELARTMPSGWGLAVNPVSPIGVLVAPEDVPTLVPDAAALAAFVPATELEGLLRDALAALDGEVLLDLLVIARVTVPTQAVDVDGLPTIPVFTSSERYHDFFAGHGLDLATVDLDLVAVVRQWPEGDFRLAVNPGSPIAFSLGGDRVRGLLTYAAELAHRRTGNPPPAPPATETGAPEPPIPQQRVGGVADLLRGGDG